MPQNLVNISKPPDKTFECLNHIQGSSSFSVIKSYTLHNSGYTVNGPGIETEINLLVLGLKSIGTGSLSISCLDLHKLLHSPPLTQMHSGFLRILRRQTRHRLFSRCQNPTQGRQPYKLQLPEVRLHKYCKR